MECSHCGGAVHLDETADPDHTSAETGADGDKVWCSDICRQVVVEGKWPSPVGPATHDEMVGWIAAQDREDAARFDRRRRAEATAQAKFDAAVSAAVARALADKEGTA